MPWRIQNQPTIVERVIGGFCYLTAGLIGIIYIVLARGGSQSQFFRFHFMQSIILAILLLLIGWAGQFLFTVVLSVAGLVGGADADAGRGMILGAGTALSWIGSALYLVPVYGMLFAFLGKFAEVPFISDVVRQQMR